MADGLSSADLRARAAVPTLKRTKADADLEENPVQEALKTREKVLAQRMLDKTIAEETVDSQEAMNRGLELQVRRRELEASLREPGDNAVLTQLLAEVHELREKYLAVNQQLSEQQMAQVQAQLQAMQDALAQVQGGRPSVVEQMRQEITEAKALVEMLSPSETPPPGGDTALEAWKIRAELDKKRIENDQERWRAEHDGRQAATIAEISQRKALAEDELAAKRELMERQGRFFTDTAPKLVSLGEQLLTALTQRQGQPAGSPSNVLTASALSPGVERMSCQRCGVIIFYRREWPGVICPHCGAEYINHPDQPPPAADETATPADEATY